MLVPLLFSAKCFLFLLGLLLRVFVSWRWYFKAALEKDSSFHLLWGWTKKKDVQCLVVKQNQCDDGCIDEKMYFYTQRTLP